MTERDRSLTQFLAGGEPYYFQLAAGPDESVLQAGFDFLCGAAGWDSSGSTDCRVSRLFVVALRELLVAGAARSTSALYATAAALDR